MQSDAFLIDLVEKYLPDESEPIGHANIAAIVKGNKNFQKPEGALNIDLTGSIQLVLALIGAVNSAWSIYDKWKTSRTQALSHNELKEELLKGSELPPELLSRIDELLAEVIKFKETNNQATEAN